MSSDGTAIRVDGLSKHYLMFARPEDRLKQSIMPRLQRLFGGAPKQYYRDFAALRDVSFTVKRGETVGIIGRNGSGKSTLLQIICGTLHPTEGSVKVNGRIAALLELGAGFNPDFTGRENVYLNGAILGLSREEIDARFDQIAAFADIGEFIEQPVKTYSSGMYVRLAFAVAINVDPDILVVDEALSVGDEAFQRKCFARIEDIRDKGGTILFVTHSTQTVVQLCDRAMLFDRGELILEGRPKTVVGQYQRLANASSEAADDIRTQVLAMRRSMPPPAAVTDLSAKGPLEVGSTAAMDVAVAQSNGQVTELQQEDGLADYYDRDLVSQSTVVLEERGASIRDVRITTLHGDPVNVLRLGRRYVFEYQVDFSVDTRDVGFGMFVRTVSGLHISGAQTRHDKTMVVTQVRAGSTSRVRYEFTCVLRPGTYFLGAGVVGSASSPGMLMARVIDAVAARVASEAILISTDYIDMSPVPQIETFAPVQHDG